MTTRRDALREALGPVGIWSFALQTRPAAEEQAAVTGYEALGYGAAWFPESLGSKEALSHAALLLAGSSRILVATGIANIYARDAAAMINGARTLAEAYPGRFVLGIGVSHAPSVAARGGIYGPPLATMTAYLDAMDAAEYAGPPPAAPPPVILAALGPRMLELAARAGGRRSPVLRPGGAHAVRTGAAGTGPRPGGRDDGGDRHRSRACPGDGAGASRGGISALANYANNLRRLGWSDEDLAGGGSDRLLDAVVPQGDAAAIAASRAGAPGRRRRPRVRPAAGARPDGPGPGRLRGAAGRPGRLLRAGTGTGG